MGRYASVGILIGVALLFSSGIFFAAQASSASYVVYEVTFAGPGTAASHSFTVNETVTPTAQSDFSIFSVSLTGSVANYSLSRLMNTTNFPETFPIVPPISNESFTYARSGYEIQGNVASPVPTTINFDGTKYSGRSYAFSATIVNSTGGSSTVVGNLVAAPSGLLYSIEATGKGGASVSATLISTDLSFAGASPANPATSAAVVGAGLVGAAALAVPFWTLGRKKKREQSSKEEKPAYWVD